MSIQHAQALSDQIKGISGSYHRELGQLLNLLSLRYGNQLEWLHTLMQLVTQLEKRHKLEIQLLTLLADMIAPDRGPSDSPEDSSPRSEGSAPASSESSSSTVPTSAEKLSLGPQSSAWHGCQFCPLTALRRRVESYCAGDGLKESRRKRAI